MSRSACAAALAAVLFLAGAASARTQEASRNLREAASDALLQQGLTTLYNLDYAKTHENAALFIAKNPENPLGYLYVSGALWWQTTTEHGILEQDPDMAKRFDDAVDRTVEISNALIQDGDRSQKADGFFAAGMALGLRGQMKLVDRKMVAAYRDGKKAMKHLGKCVKLDPNYFDAYMGLGIFDYQVAVLPGVLRFGAKILFRGTGDAPRGLRRIRMGIDKGKFASRQAAAFLLSLLVLHERDYPEALRVTRELLKAFPESPYYRFVEAGLLHRTGDPAASLQRAQALFDRLAREPDSFWRKQRGTLCGLYGPDCLDEHNLEGGITWTTAALAESEKAGAKPPAGWTAALRLYRGMFHDIIGKRELATADFTRAAELPDFHGTRAWAAACRAGPCGRAELLRLMRGNAPG